MTYLANCDILLNDFLYEAIFIPEGVEAPPKEIINAPELQIYVQDFGKQEGDICFVAEVDKKIASKVPKVITPPE